MALRWGKLVNDIREVGSATAEGFDFVQAGPGLAAILSAAGPASAPLPLEACALPLPADARVTLRGFNHFAWTAQLRTAMERMASLGCRKLLWSDGRARVLPEEGEVGELKEQVLLFLSMLCDLADGRGMAVLVEPLGPRRTNFLNTPGEAAEFLGRARRANLGILVSLRELGPMGMDPESLAGKAGLPGYVQLEHPGNAAGPRRCPRAGDGYDYAPFLRALKAAGYAAEIGLPDDADAAGLQFCKRLWDAV